MKALGIVSEYNPFHNGHRFQIKNAKEQSGADVAIAVMSGNYVQRGDVAVYSKHERARLAVLGGADIVLNCLPYFRCVRHFLLLKPLFFYCLPPAAISLPSEQNLTT